MTDVKYDDPQSYRYCDHPRPGSIYRLLDIPSLVRGPTLVLMPSGKEIKVPAQMKQDVASPAETHDMNESGTKLRDLMKILNAKQGPSAPTGFKMGRAGAYQQARNHPREQLRRARHGGGTLHF